MKERTLAVYERKSTLWKNANGFYHAQNWTKMECKETDYTEEIQDIHEIGFRWVAMNGEDVTEQEIQKRYGNGKKFYIVLTNERRTNTKCLFYDTKEEANKAFKEILTHKVFNGWTRVA